MAEWPKLNVTTDDNTAHTLVDEKHFIGCYTGETSWGFIGRLRLVMVLTTKGCQNIGRQLGPLQSKILRTTLATIRHVVHFGG